MSCSYLFKSTKKDQQPHKAVVSHIYFVGQFQGTICIIFDLTTIFLNLSNLQS